MTHVTIIAIDFAKSVFLAYGLNKANKKVSIKQLKRKDPVHEFRHYLKALIAMEACGISHHWARAFSNMGFTAQRVKAFVRGN